MCYVMFCGENGGFHARIPRVICVVNRVREVRNKIQISGIIIWNVRLDALIFVNLLDSFNSVEK